VTKWDEDKQDWTSRGHAEEGAFLTRMRLYDWHDVEQREYIVSLVRNHMIMHDLLNGDPTERLKRFRWHFFDNTNVMYHHQCLLCMCDDYGSLNREACLAERMDTQKKIRNLIPSQWNCMIEKNDNEIEVYVLIGLPGSGKSSWAAINYPGLPRVSRDDARAELGLCEKGEKYLGTREEEDKVTRYCENKILDIVGSGSGVIIDNTHLKRAYREKIHDLLKNFKVKYIYVYVEAPSLDENIRRREKDGFGSKSSEIILKMLKGFEFPYGYEYDDLIIVKQRAEES
jgi:predicted kinase